MSRVRFAFCMGQERKGGEEGNQYIAAVVGTKASGIPYVAENEKNFPSLSKEREEGKTSIYTRRGEDGFLFFL